MRFIILFLLISTLGFAQDFTNIKAKTDRYRNIDSAEKLADKINKDFTSDDDKVKALFCWLTSNISYDLEEYYNPSSRSTYFRYRTEEERIQKLEEIKNKTVTKTIIGRKAVCEGYARTFHKVCTLLGIESEVIGGYARFGYPQIGKPQSNTNHAWNAVKLNGKWQYIDATWGAGSVVNGQWQRIFKPYYFNISKEHYFKTHLPETDKWKHKIGDITKKEFYNQPIYSERFLASGVELIQPKKGTIRKNSDGTISFSFKNAIDKEFLVGFLSSNVAKRPVVSNSNGITTVSIIPPASAKVCFLLINREVNLQFLIE